MITRIFSASGLRIAAGSFLVLVLSFAANESHALAGPGSAIQRVEQWLGLIDDTDDNAPVDFGPGPGIKLPGVAETRISAMASSSGTPKKPIPNGSSTTGVFSSVVAWPIIPIHVVLLPDGRVMNYGTSTTGAQGAELIYDVWDPTVGTGTSAHTLLPNSTSTDIFCSAQSVMLSGDVLTSGGDLTVNGARNSAQNKTTIFSPTANSLTSNTPMNYARWYASLVSLPNGQLAIFGGRQNVGQLTPADAVPTPELYDPTSSSWTLLTGATSTLAFGPGAADWYYPRSHVAPGGDVFVLAHSGKMFYISTAGTGKITKSAVTAPVGSYALPTIPFAPGKLLSLVENQGVVVVDYSTSTPVVTATSNMDQVRYWASGSVMADGTVLVTGGSEVIFKLTGVAYQAQIWSPTTGQWTAAATAVKPRLYHSNSLLLPDATVLTGGGGAPGPVKNLNAEIFYPPYLYASDGTPAVRPVISSVASSFLNPGDTLSLTVGPTDTISRLTFIRTGSATHSNNSDQRFLDLAFTQEGQNVTAVLPTDTTTIVPGYYMAFAFNTAGVPSLAAIIQVM